MKRNAPASSILFPFAPHGRIKETNCLDSAIWPLHSLHRIRDVRQGANMAGCKDDDDAFHIRSPLIHSKPLSQLLGRKVYLKLDNLQPSGGDLFAFSWSFPSLSSFASSVSRRRKGSFKIRGIGRTCQLAVASGASRLVGSSGGNAGLAMAHAAEELNVPLSLFVPTTTPQIVLDKLKVGIFRQPFVNCA